VKEEFEETEFPSQGPERFVSNWVSCLSKLAAVLSSLLSSKFGLEGNYDTTKAFMPCIINKVCWTKSYRMILENEITEESWNGIEDSDVQSVTCQEKQISLVGEKPLDGVDVRFFLCREQSQLGHAGRSWRLISEYCRKEIE
jgi:hypothetical protein